MSDSGIKFETQGTVGPNNTQTPKAILAVAQARVELAKVIICGVVVFVITLGWVGALVWRPDASKEILAVLLAAMGYLAGRHSSGKENK